MFCCCSSSVEAEEPTRLKMVIVGDGDCGKTCLLHRFTYDEFFSEYTPTVFEVETKTVCYKSREVQLVMYDTAGQEDYDRLRPLSYSETDVIVICFSLDFPDSLDNVLLNWLPEVRFYCGNVPILLVGNKKDLCRPDAHGSQLEHTEAKPEDGSVPLKPAPRDGSSLLKKRFSRRGIVTFEEGQATASKIGAIAYLETSAKTGEGIEIVFEAVVRAGMAMKKKSRRLFGRRKP